MEIFYLFDAGTLHNQAVVWEAVVQKLEGVRVGDRESQWKLVMVSGKSVFFKITRAVDHR
jgi:hypothetical protein